MGHIEISKTKNKASKYPFFRFNLNEMVIDINVINKSIINIIMYFLTSYNEKPEISLVIVQITDSVIPLPVYSLHEYQKKANISNILKIKNFSILKFLEKNVHNNIKVNNK